MTWFRTGRHRRRLLARAVLEVLLVAILETIAMTPARALRDVSPDKESCGPMQVAANSFDRLWATYHREIIQAFDRVGKSGWYILGRACAAFEADLATFCGQAHAIGCGNGMDAIAIALKGAGIGPGDKVLTTPLSAFATALAVVRAGAEPVFCDVDEYGLLDPDAVEMALADNPDVRCILPVHLYGHLADMERIARLAKDTGAVVIEDAAQAIGARRGCVRVGDLSQAACLSFYPTKNLGALGDGGAVVTSDAKLAELSRTLRNYGQSAQYVHDEVGLNSRLDEVQAALLAEVFLPRLNGWTARRRTIAKHYLSEIHCPHVVLMPGPDPEGSVWHLFPVLVASDRRNAFLAHLAAAGVQAGRHYPILIPYQKAMQSRGIGRVVGDLKRAATFASGEVSLPINPFLTDDEVAHVAATVSAWGG